MSKPTIAAIRRAVADYMESEGCSCCCDTDSHTTHAATLGKLLAVPQYADRSGHDFPRFRTSARTKHTPIKPKEPTK